MLFATVGERLRVGIHTANTGYRNRTLQGVAIPSERAVTEFFWYLRQRSDNK